MKNTRCNQRKLSISSDRRLSKRKLSRDVEGLINAAVQEQTHLPEATPCYFDRTHKLIKNLSREYTQLGQQLKGILASEQIKVEANEKEVNELKNLYNALKMKEAENKRRRWCNWCELEASFLSSKGHLFYCSTDCEKKHLDSLPQFHQNVS